MLQEVPDVLVLIGPRFEETAVFSLVASLRKQGLTTAMIGVTAGIVCGQSGISICPDASLAQADALVTTKRQTLIIAGGIKSASAFLTDPRTRRLIHHILDNEGTVLALPRAYRLMVEVGVAEGGRKVEGEETAVVAEYLLDKD